MTLLRIRLALTLLVLASVSACAKEAPPADTASDVQENADSGREAPPRPAAARKLVLPPVEIVALDNGLQLNTIVADQLPVVYATLVVRSGAESDPDRLPGLSGLVAQMLKEGTTKRSSAALAEEIEFLGADLWASSDEENTYVGTVSYTHLTLPTTSALCRSRWSADN